MQGTAERSLDGVISAAGSTDGKVVTGTHDVSVRCRAVLTPLEGVRNYSQAPLIGTCRLSVGQMQCVGRLNLHFLMFSCICCFLVYVPDYVQIC